MSDNANRVPRSTSHAMQRYYRLGGHLEGFSLRDVPLPDDVREEMDLLCGWLNPEGMAQNLAAALRALWCAVLSRELSESDQADTLWLLSEWSAAIADAVFAKQELSDCLHHDELLSRRAAGGEAA